MLKKPHNILLFSLAVVDMLTGKAHSFTPFSCLSTKYYHIALCLLAYD